MSRRSLTFILAIMALTVMSVSVWAKNDSGDTITANVLIKQLQMSARQSSRPANTKSSPMMEARRNSEQGNKVVAEVPCTLKDFSGKVIDTTFVMDHDP